MFLIFIIILAIYHADSVIYSSTTLSQINSLRKQEAQFSKDGNTYATSQFDSTAQKVFIIIYKSLNGSNLTLSQNITLPGTNAPLSNIQDDAQDNSLILSNDGTSLMYLDNGQQRIFYYKAAVNGNFPITPTATGILTLNPFGGHFIDNLICVTFNTQGPTKLYNIDAGAGTITQTSTLNAGSLNNNSVTCQIAQDKSFVIVGGNINLDVYTLQTGIYQFGYTITNPSRALEIQIRGNFFFLADKDKISRYQRVNPSSQFGSPLTILQIPNDFFLGLQVSNNGNNVFTFGFISRKYYIYRFNVNNFAYVQLENAVLPTSSPIDIAVPDNGRYMSFAFDVNNNLKQYSLSCPTGTYLADLATLSCLTCSTNISQCLTCQLQVNNTLTCLSCQNTFMVVNRVCVPQCIVANCATCAPLLNTVCRRCVSGFGPVNNRTVCQRLNCSLIPGCLTCQLSLTQQLNCLSCINNQQPRFDKLKCICNLPLFLQDGNNSKSCIVCNVSDHYVKDGNCFRCQPQCNGCNQIGANCIKCANNFYTDRGNIYTCVACNGVGQFISASQCLRCSKQCLNCLGSPSNCLQCSQFYYPFNGNSSNCVNCLQNGVYLFLGNCLLCSNSCASCSGSATNCTNCVSPLFLIKNGTNSFCSQVCNQTGMIIYLGFCTQCRVPCGSCINTPFQCASCVTGLFLNGTQCSQCLLDSGYFRNGTNCQRCDPTCLTCLGNSKNCQSCRNGSVLINGQCRLCSNPLCLRCQYSITYCLQCQPGYNANPITGQCRPI